MKLESVQVEEKCIRLYGRSLWGSAVLAVAAAQPAIWYWVTKRAWKPETNQPRGSNCTTVRALDFWSLSRFAIMQGTLKLELRSPPMQYRSYVKVEACILFPPCVLVVNDMRLWLHCCHVKPCRHCLWAQKSRGVVWRSWIILFNRELLYDRSFLHF